MLRIVLLSLFWAICSTCLVRPWFWKAVKNKKLLDRNYGKVGFSSIWKIQLGEQIVFFILVCYGIIKEIGKVFMALLY